MGLYTVVAGGRGHIIEAETAEKAKAQIAEQEVASKITVRDASRAEIEAYYRKERNEEIMQDRAGRIQKRIKRMRTRSER